MSFWTLRDRPDVELVACPSPCGLMAVVWRGLDPQVESVFLGARLAFCDFTLAISNRCIVSNTLLSRARLVFVVCRKGSDVVDPCPLVCVATVPFGGI